jgi:hypothetical protein
VERNEADFIFFEGGILIGPHGFNPNVGLGTCESKERSWEADNVARFHALQPHPAVALLLARLFFVYTRSLKIKETYQIYYHFTNKVNLLKKNPH